MVRGSGAMSSVLALARMGLCCLSFAVTLSWAHAKGRDLEQILSSGEIRICAAPLSFFINIEPPQCRRDCQLSGPYIDLALRFAEHLQAERKKPLKVRTLILEKFADYFVNDANQTIEDAVYTPKFLANQSCDLYAESLAKREWREKKVAIVTFMPGRMMIIVPKNRLDAIKSWRDLGGKSTIAERNTIYHTWLSELNAKEFSKQPMQIRDAESGSEKLEALEAGKIDFGIIDLGTALQVTNPALSKFRNLHPAFPVGPTNWGGWAFRKEDTSLAKAAERFFSQQIEDKEGGINAIFKKYFGVTHSEYLTILTSVKD